MEKRTRTVGQTAIAESTLKPGTSSTSQVQIKTDQELVWDNPSPDRGAEVTP